MINGQKDHKLGVKKDPGSRLCPFWVDFVRAARRYLPLVALATLWAVTRFYKLRSGLHLLEPDEWEYLQIANSLNEGPVPMWQGKPYFLQLPLFPILAHAVDFEWVRQVWGHFGPVRLVSVAASGVYYFWVYKLSKNIFGQTTAWWTTTIWLIVPLFWFYSRQGTTDMLALALAWGGIYGFVKAAEEQRVEKAIGAGIWLATAVIAKTNAVVFWSLPGVWFVISLVEITQPRGLRAIFSNKKLQKNPRGLLASVFPWGGIEVATATLASGGVVMGLVLVPLILIFREQFWAGIGVHPGLFLVIHPRANLALLIEYMKAAPWWLNWGGWGLVGMGLTIWGVKFLKAQRGFGLHGRATLLNCWEKKRAWLLAMTMLGLGAGQVFLLGWWYFSPRNFLLASSGGFLLVAVAIEQLMRAVKRGKVARAEWLILGAVWLVVLLAEGGEVFEATQHEVVEESLEWIEGNNKEKLPVYTTFDAEKLEEIGGFEVEWLGKEFERPAWVITDREKTGRISLLSFSTFREAREVMRKIESESQPVKIFKDEKSLFPITETKNQVEIYLPK